MPSIPILLYHSICEDGAPAHRRWCVTPREFDAQLRALSERGYRPITVADLARLRLAGRPVPPRTCLITFDDGLRDFAEGAMPVLAAHGFRATLYVVSGFVGATARWLSGLKEGGRPMLDWPALRDLHGAGVKIGAHTVSHPELDTLAAGAGGPRDPRQQAGAGGRYRPGCHGLRLSARLCVANDAADRGGGRICCRLPRSPCAQRRDGGPLRAFAHHRYERGDAGRAHRPDRGQNASAGGGDCDADVLAALLAQFWVERESVWTR
jgi:Polysaccharide deacetylase